MAFEYWRSEDTGGFGLNDHADGETRELKRDGEVWRGEGTVRA